MFISIYFPLFLVKVFLIYHVLIKNSIRRIHLSLLNLLFWSLKDLKFQLILDYLKSNGHHAITSSIYTIKCFKLFFILINLEITILSTSPSQIFIILSFLWYHEIIILLLLSYQTLTLLYYEIHLLSLFFS